jgi:hypothetical protein
MVSTDKCDTVGIADFETEKEEEGLERIEPAIDKVAHK